MKMELIAALLHSPEVLFLDEPTIGLDVVAQHNIQQFLRHYQEQRQITILLTSHYMKDVAALCRRVVIIAHGQIMYDGSLERASSTASAATRCVTLLFADDRTARRTSTATAKCSQRKPPEGEAAGRPAADRPRAWRRSCDSTPIEDVSVEDPPLEEVIAEHVRARRATAKLRAARSTRRPVPQPVHDEASDGTRNSCIAPRSRTWWTILRICARRAAGLSRRLRAGHADAVPADRHADLPLGRPSLRCRRRRRGQHAIAGYRYDDIIAYYLLTMISRAFSSMPGLACGIARQIRNGEIKKFLIQPIDMIGFSAAAVGWPTSWSTTPWRCGRSRWCSSSAAATSRRLARRRDAAGASWRRW